MELAERTTGGLHQLVSDRISTLLLRKDAKILDIGCGTGALLVRLQKLGFQHLIGIDIAPPTTIPGIQFLRSDLDNCNTQLGDGSIDLALAVEVLEHVENIGGLLQELSRLLGPLWLASSDDTECSLR